MRRVSSGVSRATSGKAADGGLGAHSTGAWARAIELGEVVVDLGALAELDPAAVVDEAGELASSGGCPRTGRRRGS